MPIMLADCTVLGGSGHPVPPGQKVTLRFGEDVVELECSDGSVGDKMHYAEILELSVSGPGAVSSGGGFFGGGFGVAGALEGMALASVLNLLTTRTKVFTMMHFLTHRGEMFLHYGGLEPGALRIALSDVFTRLRRFDPRWIEERMQRLRALRTQEVLSEELTNRLMIELTSSDCPPILSTPDPVAQRTIKCRWCGAQVYATAKICEVCFKRLA